MGKILPVGNSDFTSRNAQFFFLVFIVAIRSNPTRNTSVSDLRKRKRNSPIDELAGVEPLSSH